ncbi:MAG: CrcB family protein [Wenzhouxiangellaceae bacterium]|nr:CrcB family protein [Wenzhouxiangellaceae bacterium]
MSLTTIALTAAGSALGALLRFELGRWIGRWLGTRLPWATFTVNLLGCFLAGGLLAGSAELSPGVHTLLAAGVLGGFTTVSAFALEVHLLIRRGYELGAAVYLLASLLVMLLATIAGYRLVA